MNLFDGRLGRFPAPVADHETLALPPAMVPVTLAESYIWRSGADTIRGCMFCTHGNGDEMPANRACSHPEVTGSANKTANCIAARDHSGPCGVEARYLKLRGE